MQIEIYSEIEDASASLRLDESVQGAKRKWIFDR